VFLSRKGPLGAGTFPEAKWHKQAREDILAKLGISTEYGEEIHYGEDKSSFRTLSDFKHIELIDDYIDGKGGMGKIAKAHEVSPGTVQYHIKNHNDMVGKSGECEICRRAEGENYNRRAVRPR
jgi:hypothetical protein